MLYSVILPLSPMSNHVTNINFHEFPTGAGILSIYRIPLGGSSHLLSSLYPSVSVGWASSTSKLDLHSSKLPSKWWNSITHFCHGDFPRWCLNVASAISSFFSRGDVPCFCNNLGQIYLSNNNIIYIYVHVYNYINTDNILYVKI